MTTFDETRHRRNRLGQFANKHTQGTPSGINLESGRPRYTYPFDCTACGRQITHPSGKTGPGLAHAGHGLCTACRNAWRKAGRPPVDTFTHTYQTRPTPARYTYPFDCTGCGQTITHPMRGDGTGQAHKGHGLCTACYSAWLKAGRPPVDTFTHKLTSFLAYPFDCTGCGRTITHSMQGDGPGLAHAGHGLCATCAHAWRKAGRPPVGTFTHELTSFRAYPFDCAGCGRTITHPSKGTGPGQAHGGHGLCITCHQAWRKAGQPPLETFIHTPRTYSTGPTNCTSCHTPLARKEHPGKTPGGHGLCITCHRAWRNAGQPPLETFTHAYRPRPTPARYTYPFNCVGCGRQITHPSKGTGTGLAHASHGLCYACRSAWLKAGRPPVKTYRHPRKRRTFPFDCTSCGQTITHPAHKTGPGQAHGGHGLCVPCSQAWRRAGKPQPVATYRRPDPHA